MAMQTKVFARRKLNHQTIGMIQTAQGIWAPAGSPS